MKKFRKLTTLLLAITLLPAGAFAKTSTTKYEIQKDEKEQPISYFQKAPYNKPKGMLYYYGMYCLQYNGEGTQNEKVQGYIKNYERKYENDRDEIQHIGNYIQNLGIKYNLSMKSNDQYKTLKDGETMCVGFAWLTSKLLDKAGMDYRVAVSTPLNSLDENKVIYGAHIFFEVKISGVYRKVDPTHFRCNEGVEGLFSKPLTDTEFEAYFPTNRTIVDTTDIEKFMSWMAEGVDNGPSYNYVKTYYSPVIRGGKLISSDTYVMTYEK